MKSSLRILALALLLSGCATSYGPHGLTGGYKDQQIDDHTYAVYFYGNGHSSGDRVWNFWIYRCAELTKEKGFTAFSLSPLDKKTSAMPMSVRRDLAAYKSGEDSAPRFIQTKGGGAGTYYYVPGGTITTYTGRAIVTMYKQPYPAEAPFLLNPDKVIEILKPYIESDGKSVTPARKEILERAIVPRTTPA